MVKNGSDSVHMVITIPEAKPPAKAKRGKVRRFLVLEVIGEREAESEERIRDSLPKGRVFKIEEVSK